MTENFDDPSFEITEVTRRAIVDHFSVSGVAWAGRMRDGDFLARLYDLSSLPSYDSRCKDAAADIYQHTVRNHDWEMDWVFTDRRFNLLRAPDAELLRFLCETVHPVVRPDPDGVDALVAIYNQALAKDGFQIVPIGEISGKPTFAGKSARRATVFDLPTGWIKVDRQIQEARFRLDAAATEEQFQGVGLLCREVLISIAQEIHDSQRHMPIDGKEPSETDAKRMLEAIFETELAGSGNGEARTQAKAAVSLALALQLKRSADFKTAALCVEGTFCVVNMLAIVTGRRGKGAG